MLAMGARVREKFAVIHSGRRMVIEVARRPRHRDGGPGPARLAFGGDSGFLVDGAPCSANPVVEVPRGSWVVVESRGETLTIMVARRRLGDASRFHGDRIYFDGPASFRVERLGRAPGP